MHDFDENEKDCYMDFIIHKFDEMAVVLAARQRRGEAEVLLVWGVVWVGVSLRSSTEIRFLFNIQ